MLLVALIVGGIVAGAVWLKRRSAEAPASDSAPIASESSPAAASAGHRYARFIELSGFRISEDAKRRATVRLAVTNHNAADLGDLSLTVTLKNSEGQELGTSDIKLASLEPLSSVDVTAPFKTKLRAYEVPDWQFIRAEFEITSK